MKLNLAESYKGFRQGCGFMSDVFRQLWFKTGSGTTFSSPTTESLYEVFVQKIVVVGDSGNGAAS